MTMFFLDNPEIFRLNLVSLPKKYIQNFRLTLDYKEDLRMFNELVYKLREKKLKINLSNIFKILKSFKYIDKINNKKKLIYNSRKFRKNILKYTKINYAI